MRAIEVYNKAIMLLGYNTGSISENNRDSMQNRALDVINNICIDLNIATVNSFTDDIMANVKQFDALCTGTAMLISLLEGDSNKNVIFTGLYNAKRAIALARSATVRNVVPFDDGGVD